MSRKCRASADVGAADDPPVRVPIHSYSREETPSTPPPISTRGRDLDLHQKEVSRECLGCV